MKVAGGGISAGVKKTRFLKHLEEIHRITGFLTVSIALNSK
jgi:hypothetical protein